MSVLYRPLIRLILLFLLASKWRQRCFASAGFINAEARFEVTLGVAAHLVRREGVGLGKLHDLQTSLVENHRATIEKAQR